VVLTKTADKKIRAAARNFSPDKLEAPESRKLKLLKQWAIACEAALESLCKLRDINEIDWRPGFVFDETMEACHKLSNDGAHTLMLNPIHINGNDIGKIKFSITNFNSHVELLTLAAHEVAHCEHKWHDESYAGLFTDIISDMMKNINILSKEMKAA
jgi:cobalamin biosynthesis Co2+ chelatase CbiK